MAKDTSQQQPRSLSQELAIQQPGLYRAGLYQELQQFGNRDRARQLLLSEMGLNGQDLEAQVDMTGLDLSVGEQKALHACLILLDETGYQGNRPPRELIPQGYSEPFDIPRLAVTFSEYLEAYGAPKKGKGRILALEDLESLTQSRRVAYKRRRWEGQGKKRREIWDAIVTHTPLIILHEGYKDLGSEREADQALAGRSRSRVTHLVIEFSPLLIDQVNSFFLLKPISLFREIEGHLGGKRYSPAVPLFLKWLMTKNRTPWRISKELLAERLRLYSLIDQRKPSLLDQRLQQAIDTAMALGYLLEWDLDEFGMYTFQLNPERCLRIGQPGEDEEDK